MSHIAQRQSANYFDFYDFYDQYDFSNSPPMPAPNVQTGGNELLAPY